jgi:mannose-1-phosphate guanylyltransferase/phosphomannomutase
VKAVVMAGGAGSRLRPLTINRPKPMVPIVNKPVMGHIFDLLKRHGITDVIVTLQYMAEDVQDYFGSGHSFGMNIEYSIEEVPLGTAGSVKLAQELLDETFLVISGDAVTDIDLTKVIAFHQEKKAKATLTLYRVSNPLEYGVIITDNDGRIQQFQEKPSWGEVISDTVNTGIYVLEPEVLDHFEHEVKFDFSQDLFPILLERGDPMYGYVADGYWCDVGNIAEYMRATGDVLGGQVKVEPVGHRLEQSAGVWGEDGVEIAPTAQLYGPVFLGRGVKVMDGVIIHGPTVIRDYSVVDRYAHIDRSIVWRNCYIGEGVELRGAIVGRQCSLKRKVVVFEGAVVGDSSVVGDNAVIHPGVKIWPDKEVEAGATVRSSIIWGAQGRRVLFGRYGVTGLVNVDLTPEFAAKLGAAFAATLPKGAVVTINRDPNRSPRMLKRALISGLPSAGVNVLDVRSLPIPVARYYTGRTEALGGVHVRLSPYDSRLVDIKFCDRRGQDLSQNGERNIERVFFREDFRRVFLDEIGTIGYANEVADQYIKEYLDTLQTTAIALRSPHIAVDFANAPTAQVLAPIRPGSSAAWWP